MFSKFWKASLCVSAALTLAPNNSFSFTDKVFTEPSKEEIRKRNERLAQLLAEQEKLQTIKKKEIVEKKLDKKPRHFFERPVLESLSKVALYHLVGFVGYLPYVSTVLNYLMIPLIPFNVATDGFLIYMFTKQSSKFEFQDKSWSSKEICQIADYMSYAFGFVSAGGIAKGVPAFLGMIASMYAYTLISKEKYNRNEAVLYGALGATIPMLVLSQTFTFWIGKYKRIPFALGIFAFYAGFSWFINDLMQDYLEDRNVEKIPSVLLSSYKWSYLYLVGMWKFFGSEDMSN